MNIWEKADELVRQSNGRLTRSEALSQLARRRRYQPKKYGRTEIKPADRPPPTVEPSGYWWNKD